MIYLLNSIIARVIYCFLNIAGKKWGSSKKRKANYFYNNNRWNASPKKGNNRGAVAEKPYIESQHGKYGGYKYGNYSFNHNGCAAIAAYNCLLSIDKTKNLPDIIRGLEERAVVFGGKYGTSPLGVVKYLKTVLGEGDFVIIKGPGSLRNIGKSFRSGYKGYRAYIVLIISNTEKLSEGLHYMALTEKSNKKWVFHNNPKGLRGEYLSVLKALDEVKNNKSFPVCLIGVK